MLVNDAEKGHPCLVSTCWQVALTIGGKKNVHRAGNFTIPFIQEWTRAFLYLANPPRHDMFPPFTSVKESLLYDLQTKSGAGKITEILHKNKLMRKPVICRSPNEVGGQVGHQGAVHTVKDQIQETTVKSCTMAEVASELGRRGHRGAVHTVQDQIEETTGKSCTTVEVASELGRRGH